MTIRGKSCRAEGRHPAAAGPRQTVSHPQPNTQATGGQSASSEGKNESRCL